MKTSFRTRVLRMGLGSFVDIDFCYEILLYLFFLHSPIFSNLLDQNLQKFKTPKRKLAGVSFKDTLLNFGLYPALYIYIYTLYNYMFNIQLINNQQEHKQKHLKQ